MSSGAPRDADALRKLLRFTAIYGPGRTLFKAAGRMRVAVPAVALRRPERSVGLIGCGQFGFATISYFLQRRFGSVLAACYDVDPAAAHSLARAMRVPAVCDSVEALLGTPGLRTVYIASNHASHADQAARALDRGLDVYVEKPIAVDEEQLTRLLRARRRAAGRLFAGYNRPYSGAVRDLRRAMTIRPQEGLTIECFVSGHRLGPDHWYRRPEEGTRICGNLGHWLDLMVHVLHLRGLPRHLDVAATWADDAEPDDNLHVAMRSDLGDLLGVTLTSRCEPFEGIRESIHLQHGDTIAEIEDFRRLHIRQGARLTRRRYWPKDVGHRAAILQPFAPAGEIREFGEVELSTLLMLHVADMVRSGRRESTFSFDDARAWLNRLEGT